MGAHAAAAQLRGVLARHPRNRESTVMSATNLLRLPLPLLCSIYEAAIDASREHGPLDPPLRAVPSVGSIKASSPTHGSETAVRWP